MASDDELQTLHQMHDYLVAENLTHLMPENMSDYLEDYPDGQDMFEDPYIIGGEGIVFWCVLFLSPVIILLNLRCLYSIITYDVIPWHQVWKRVCLLLIVVCDLVMISCQFTGVLIRWHYRQREPMIFVDFNQTYFKQPEIPFLEVVACRLFVTYIPTTMLMASNYLWVIMWMYRLVSISKPFKNINAQYGPRYGRHVLVAVVVIAAIVNLPAYHCVDVVDDGYGRKQVCSPSHECNDKLKHALVMMETLVIQVLPFVLTLCADARLICILKSRYAHMIPSRSRTVSESVLEDCTIISLGSMSTVAQPSRMASVVAATTAQLINGDLYRDPITGRNVSGMHRTLRRQRQLAELQRWLLTTTIDLMCNAPLTILSFFTHYGLMPSKETMSDNARLKIHYVFWMIFFFQFLILSWHIHRLLEPDAGRQRNRSILQLRSCDTDRHSAGTVINKTFIVNSLVNGETNGVTHKSSMVQKTSAASSSMSDVSIPIPANKLSTRRETSGALMVSFAEEDCGLVMTDFVSKTKISQDSAKSSQDSTKTSSGSPNSVDSLGRTRKDSCLRSPRQMRKFAQTHVVEQLF